MPVLIVEDDRPTLFAYSQLLLRAGYEVFEAQSGQAALNLLDSGLVPGLVLIDLGLPDVSGDELITYLHDDLVLRNVPTIVITGREPERARHLTADRVLFKPLAAAELMTAVATLHRGSSQRPIG